MTKTFLDFTLGSLARAGSEAVAGRICADAARDLLRLPEEVGALVRRFAEDDDEADAATGMLLGGLLDEARMARENGVKDGDAVLDLVEATLSALRAEGRLSPPLRMVLARIFTGVGLEPPDAVLIHAEEFGAIGAGVESAGEDPRIEALIDEMVVAIGDEPLELHAAISQTIAVFPPAIRGSFVAAVVGGDRPFALRLGTYFLLDRTPDVRRAAAETLRTLAGRKGLDRTTLATLVAVRKWLPAEPARALVDEAVKASLRSAPESAQDSQATWTVQRVVASLPDGAGAQSIALALQQGRRRSIAMLLIKQGHGVKDAFFVPCSGAAEQKRVLTRIAGEMGGIELEAAFVPAALSRALGDGAARGALPAPGLVDMAAIWSDDVAPAASDAASIIAAIDRDRTVPALSARESARLTGAGSRRLAHRDLTGSWFEDNTALSDALSRQTSAGAAETVVWEHLEGRRTWWATLIARAAATLRASVDQPAEDWLALAATAQALLDGKPMKKSAIMRAVAERSLAAWAEGQIAQGGEEWDEDGAEDGNGDEPDGPAGFAPGKPELPGEFAALIAGSGRSAAWFEGHLAAMAAAPNFVSPQAWLGPVMAVMKFPDLASLNRFFELLMARGNALADPSAGPVRVAAALAGHDDAGQRAWAAGFTAFATGVKRAWPARALGPDDRRMLKSLATAAKAGLDDATTRLLATWIAHRYRVRR